MTRKAVFVLPLLGILALCASVFATPDTSVAQSLRGGRRNISLAASPTPGDAPGQATRRPSGKCASARRRIEPEGQKREYLIHVPPALLPATPLVIVLHGYKGTAESMEQYSGFSAVADRAGFLVVYPQAQGESAAWNLNLGPNNDVAFLNAVMDDAQAICGDDPARVYVVGLSRGGGMANRLACDDAPRIAAVAAVSGAFYRHLDCSPARPMPILAIHGLKDSVVPFEGRPESPDNLHATPKLRDWAAAWASRDGCSLVPDPTSPVQGEQRQTWRNCRAQSEVVLRAIEQMGHEWPSAPTNAADAVWDFFQRH